MIEGRNCENRGGVECVNPGEDHKPVRLRLVVAQPAGIELLILEVVRVGIVGNLIVVPAQLGIEPKLVFLAQVVDQRGESAEAVLGVVENLRDRGFQPQVTAIGIQTGIVGESLRVASKIDLVVRLVIASEGGASSPSLLRSNPDLGSTLNSPYVRSPYCAS